MDAKPISTDARDQPPRILIVRLTAFGDVVHGVPVACALRRALPNAFIAWIAEGRAGDVLEGHPALNMLIRVPRRFWKSPREIWKLRTRLRELNFDVAIDLQCLTKSAVTARLSGARRRIGRAGVEGRELSRIFNNELIDAGGAHVIEQYLSMLKPLGITSPTVEFNLPERETDAAAIDKFLRANGLVGHRFAVLNPGAAGLRRFGRQSATANWPVTCLAITGCEVSLPGGCRPRSSLPNQSLLPAMATPCLRLRHRCWN